MYIKRIKRRQNDEKEIIKDNGEITNAPYKFESITPLEEEEGLLYSIVTQRINEIKIEQKENYFRLREIN